MLVTIGIPFMALKDRYKLYFIIIIISLTVVHIMGEKKIRPLGIDIIDYYFILFDINSIKLLCIFIININLYHYMLSINYLDRYITHHYLISLINEEICNRV